MTEASHRAFAPAITSKSHQAGTFAYRANCRRRENSLDVSVVRGSERVGTHISGESLLVILLVGVIAGWLAGKIVEGSGFGLIGDMAVGIVGALIGSWLMPRLGIHLASGMLSAIIVATIGAVLLLVIVRLVTGGSPRRRSWRF
jgi:uncharacterized membrane protein YeaQ/YmgE (transglycosylase-associated protein family)